MKNNHQQTQSHMAFISYKREDEKWAKWLQNKLESYRLPISVRKEKKGLPEFVRPIFRDTTDLSGGVLAKTIKAGLDSSRYLIVICSPRASKSQWVCKEVQEFIDSGREENIIPFIIEGEANSSNIEKECFPEALRKLSGERELLGINVNENGRDVAFVKVIARMLNLQFDTLWNRHKRRERKRRNIFIAAAVAFILGLLAVASWIGWQNIELSKKNEQIEKQNKELDAKSDSIQLANANLFSANRLIQQANDSIIKQKESLQKAYNNLAISERNLLVKTHDLEMANKVILEERNSMYIAQSKAVAEKALKQIAQGDVYNAMMALLEVLPADLQKPERPYVAEADAALRVALDSLENGKGWLSYVIQSEVDKCFFTNTDKNIVCLSDKENSCVVNVYDASTYQLKQSFNIPSFDPFVSGGYCYSYDGKYMGFEKYDSLYTYSLESGKLIRSQNVKSENQEQWFDHNNMPMYLYSDDYKRDLLVKEFSLPDDTELYDYNSNCKYAVILCNKRKIDSYNTQGTFKLLDCKSGNVLWERDSNIELGFAEISNIAISPFGNYLAIAGWNTDYSIQLVNINTNILQKQYIEDSNHYSNSAHFSKSENLLFLENELTDTYVFSTKDLSLIAVFANNGAYSGHYALQSNKDDDKILCINGSAATVLIKNEGTRNKSKINKIINELASKGKTLQDIELDILLEDETIVNENLIIKSSDTELICKKKGSSIPVWTYRDKGYYIQPVKFLFNNKYILVHESGNRGFEQYCILNTETGVKIKELQGGSVYVSDQNLLQKEYPNEFYNFLDYPNLILQCNNLVKGMKMNKSARNSYFLE